MSWFDDQIRERRRREDENFAEAVDEIKFLLNRGKTDGLPDGGEGMRQRSMRRAVGDILDYFHIRHTEAPESIEDVQTLIDTMCRPHGIMYRKVRLDEGWHREVDGVYLIKKKDGTAVALLPSRLSGYGYYDRALGMQVVVTDKSEAEFEREAFCLYRPLPLRPLRIEDLMHFAMTSVPASSYYMLIAVMLAATLVGMVTPQVIRLLFRDVIPGGSGQQLCTMAVLLVCGMLGALLMNAVRTMMSGRIRMRMNTAVRAAVMARMLALSPKIYKQYSAGEMADKVRRVSALCDSLHTRLMMAGLSALFSLLYLIEVWLYAPALLGVSLLMLFAGVALAILAARLSVSAGSKAMEASAKTKGMAYALISGIQKIRLSGAEKRAFTRYMRAYAQELKHTYGATALPQVIGGVAMVVPVIGGVALYAGAAHSGVSPADYYAFMAAFGLMVTPYGALVRTLLKSADIAPAIEQIKPILQAQPEVAQERKLVKTLKGGIEMNNVSFRYEENMPWVLDNLSFKIRAGQYVAIVGRTGCGKSTLLRLLLGFETPQKGAIYYDRQDVTTLDLKSLRSRIGVVMQNGKLFQEDIFSNITISAPGISMEGAWEAAELAGIADDIRAMPMGMHTVISAGGGGISGGQRQRLLIARAIAPKPRILMFDEATSALDNITQKKISDALGGLKCTRIVIAHRLSTIRQCDRILVLDGGRIAEDGTYDELIKRGGIFAELVERQKMEKP